MAKIIKDLDENQDKYITYEHLITKSGFPYWIAGKFDDLDENVYLIKMSGRYMLEGVQLDSKYYKYKQWRRNQDSIVEAIGRKGLLSIAKMIDNYK